MNDFISIPENPAPDGAEVFSFVASDGAELRGAFFPAENPRGTVLLVTGWSEFIEKYFETIGDLHARGLNVAMMDWRGQGLSDRTTPREAKWQDYFRTISNDLRDFAESQVKPRFSGPYILMTHSMGGLPALMLLSEGYPGFERAVLCAPMTRLFPESENKRMGVVANALTSVGLARTNTPRGKNHAAIFDGNIFTSDETRHTRFTKLREAEPKAASTTPTFGWVNDAIKSSKHIHAESALDDIQTPVLIISAGAEQQIDGADHANIADASDQVSLKIIDGALHEIMMERDEIRAQYFEAFDAFTKPALSA